MAVVPWDVASLKVGGVEVLSAARALSAVSGSFSTTLGVTGNTTLTGMVGVGIAPSTYPLRVFRQTASDVAMLRLQNEQAGGRACVIEFNNPIGNAYVGRESNAGGAIITGTSASAIILGGTAAYAVEICTNNAVRLQVDSAGLVTTNSHLRFNGILYGNTNSAGVATTGGGIFTGIVQMDSILVGNVGTGKVFQAIGAANSIANNATITFGTTTKYHGLFIVTDAASELAGWFNVGPSGTTLESDPGARFSNTKDTAGRLNLYVETGNLILQNKEGTTRAVRHSNIGGTP